MLASQRITRTGRIKMTGLGLVTHYAKILHPQTNSRKPNEIKELIRSTKALSPSVGKEGFLCVALVSHLFFFQLKCTIKGESSTMATMLASQRITVTGRIKVTGLNLVTHYVKMLHPQTNSRITN